MNQCPNHTAIRPTPSPSSGFLKNVIHVCHMKYPDGLSGPGGRGRGADGNFRTPIACLVGVRKGRGRKFRLRALTSPEYP